jgi:hypothetical protein
VKQKIVLPTTASQLVTDNTFGKDFIWNFHRQPDLGFAKSRKDRKTYKSFDWLISGYIGYKFEFAKKKMYVLPLFGIAGVIYKSNPWPIYEDKKLTKEVGESPFLLGSLRFGYNF